MEWYTLLIINENCNFDIKIIEHNIYNYTRVYEKHKFNDFPRITITFI